MNWIDVVILVVLLAGIVEGFVKGVVKQAFGLGGFVAGLVLGAIFYKPLADCLQEWNFISMSYQAAGVLAFILILIVVPFALSILGSLLSKLIKIAQLGFVDRLLGALFAMLKYVLVMGLVFQLLDFTGITDNVISQDTDKSQSKLYQPVRKTTDFCLRWTWNKVMPKDKSKWEKV